MVEAQGQGSPHVHIPLRLKYAPNADKMIVLLPDEELRCRVGAYIKYIIRTHLDGFD